MMSLLDKVCITCIALCVAASFLMAHLFALASAADPQQKIWVVHLGHCDMLLATHFGNHIEQSCQGVCWYVRCDDELSKSQN